MSVLRELYQEVILDHNKNPRNFRKMENPTTSVARRVTVNRKMPAVPMVIAF